LISYRKEDFSYQFRKGVKKMDIILRTENLCKYYGNGENEVRAVEKANIKITQGELVAIVGKSGSGKSTLLHMLGGLDTPSCGKVFIKEKDIFGLKEEELAIFRRRKIGFIFQTFNLVSSINVWENIVLPIGLDGKQIDDFFVKDIISTLGIEQKIYNLPNTLSGGQQQRVAIARALASKPDIILADEPTGNLDSKTSDEVMGLLKMSAAKYGQTLVMITHDEDIAQIADRIIVIEDGKVVE
jgi:putative ABC transport system ATP-binding protein